MTLSFSSFTELELSDISEIEIQCHQFPSSENLLRSCIGGRYVNVKALKGSQIIGFYIGEFIVDEMTLIDMCITPSYQGKGYGRALLAHFIEHSTEKSARCCFLEVRVSNRAAIKLYQEAGFEQIAVRKQYYPTNHGREDAMVMKLSLQ